MRRRLAVILLMALMFVCAAPDSYGNDKGMGRGEAEDRLIEHIRASDGRRSTAFEILEDRLEPYGEELFVLPGQTYQNREITRNVYLDARLSPVWDLSHPAESIANMFLFPSGIYGDVEMEMTVLKHEYGEKEVLEVTVGRALAAFEQEGCLPYWGIERMDGGKLEGALFLYNPWEGYDHVLKIECSPEEIFSGTGKVKARASLYIPTKNVDDLHAPYVKKTDKERIKYGK